MNEAAWDGTEIAAAARRLAVYGTLAPGRANAHVLEPLGGRWFDGTVRGRRINAGWGDTYGYPGLQLDPDGDEIAVQVLEAAGLPERFAELDAFEGAEYERVIAEVRTPACTLLANVYVIRAT